MPWLPSEKTAINPDYALENRSPKNPLKEVVSGPNTVYNQ